MAIAEAEKQNLLVDTLVCQGRDWDSREQEFQLVDFEVLEKSAN